MRDDSAMAIADRLACAELIQAWGRYRDQGRWPELLATFAPEGEIAVSWFRGPFREFVERSRAAFNANRRSKHLLWPTLLRGNAHRAVGETNVAILVRQSIDGVLCDLTSYARFLDRIERRDGRWLIVERAAIYEMDRLDPVEPSSAFADVIETARRSGHPEAYRYMACRLAAAGLPLARPVHHDGLPETAELYARFDAWLAGG
jgi:hypothetical protein